MNKAFWLKMTFMVLAGFNALIFHARGGSVRARLGQRRHTSRSAQGLCDAVARAVAVRRHGRALDGLRLTRGMLREPSARNDGGRQRPRYRMHDGFRMPLGFPAEGFESG